MENTIRKEIKRIIGKIPDEELKPVLNYLKKIKKSSIDIDSKKINRIIDEDFELLKKLAQ